MATMIPSTPPDPNSGPGKRAERALFDALRRLLSDDFIVLYAVHLLGAKADEAEIDFLVIHRVYGILVIECKGRDVRHGEDGVWTRKKDGRTEAMKKSPQVQAQRQVKVLTEILRERMSGSFPERPFVHGHAVAFPFARAEGNAMPLDLPRTILATADDLGRMGEWVDGAFAHWRNAARPEATPLTPKDFTRFRKQVLLPAFGLIETIGAKMCADREAIERQTDDQLAVRGDLTVNKRSCVSGAAGTGKTALAVEAARTYATAGKSVLLVCYNAGLAAHLANVCAREGACDGRIEALTFHELCHRGVVASGMPWSVPPKDDSEKGRARTKDFWDNGAPERLWDAATSGKAPKYDAIIADEAQDFHDHWAMAVEACLKDRDAGALAVFYDPAQKLWDRKWELLERAAQHELRVNFRNTRNIARAVSDVGGVDYRFLSGAPEGEKVTFAMDVPKGARTIAKVDEIVASLVGPQGVLPENIVVLSAHRNGNSLAEVKTLGGVKVTTKLAARAGKVLHSTIGAFKGLESDVVVLVDVDDADPLCDSRARYVAASRAKLVLFVVGKGEWKGRANEGRR